MGAAAANLEAQISSVRVFTQPAGAAFYVDEQFYTGEVFLLWPAGSKHFIRVEPNQALIRPGWLYTFQGATTNLGPLTSISPITADPALTFVELDFSLSYAVTLSYYSCSPGDAQCLAHSPGTVVMNGTKFLSSGQIYVPAGSVVKLEAYPASGFIFTGWGEIPGQPSGTAFLYSFTVNQPQGVHPLFQSARPIQINIGSSPPGMQLLVDRTPMSATTVYEWGWGTDHAVGAIPVQRDAVGHVMIFSNWSDGGLINHVYHMQGAAESVLSLTANFVPGAAVSFLTSPTGLPLQIDGRSNYQSYNFYWAQGATHAVSAPLTETDAQGHLYKFISWSNGAPASLQYTVPDAPDDIRITANYQPVAQVSVSSVPAGITLQVDGTSCTTPCSLQRDVGVQMNVAAPGMVPAGDTSRLVFQGWTDSSALARTLTTSLNPISLTATYQMQHQLSVSADPADAVEFSITPASADGFYDAQSPVLVSADTHPGYQFVSWSGDASGIFRPLTVVMNSPKNISVVLNPVPFVDRGGVRNAAGDTPEATVAPGSVISIVGVNLAPYEEKGPDAPLKQTLAGVTARAAGMLMPLFFVTPGEVRAQLPYEAREGDQILTLSVAGKPDVKVVFTVARNAPGLFSNPLGDIAYALAAHADGSAVTPDSPAAKGETITIYGTGFGPYAAAGLDGFALPQDGSYALTDTVDVLAGDADLQPVYAGAAANKVGVSAISFTITGDLPAGTNAPLKVRINGHDSNTVILPLQ
jgi:uncharacterized protein (TIGR03437 family)